MIKRAIAFFLGVLSVWPAAAQDTFTARLQRRIPGQGTVVLHQDAEIDALVNGAGPNIPTWAAGRDFDTIPMRIIPNNHAADTALASVRPVLGKKVRMDGYRVQVYVGGNSRDAKYKAQQVEGRIRSFYPDIDIYTRFVSPRWVCHVGDFKTREEAVGFLGDLRGKGDFSDAIVVRCKINAYAAN